MKKLTSKEVNDLALKNILEEDTKIKNLMMKRMNEMADEVITKVLTDAYNESDKYAKNRKSKRTRQKR